MRPPRFPAPCSLPVTVLVTQAGCKLASRSGESRVFIFTLENHCLSWKKEKQVAVRSNEMSAYPERSSTVTLSCQGPVAQSPISKLSGLMSVLSLVVHKAGCSKRLEGPSPLRAAGKKPTPGTSFPWPRSPWRVGKDPGVLLPSSVHGGPCSCVGSPESGPENCRDALVRFA